MKATKSTIIRTIVLATALINQILTISGLNPLPFSDNEIYEILTMLTTAGASLWTWWENNSFTKAAILADKVYEQIKETEKREKNLDSESNK